MRRSRPLLGALALTMLLAARAVPEQIVLAAADAAAPLCAWLGR